MILPETPVVHEQLWVDKYAPNSFTELLSDEQTNREVFDVTVIFFHKLLLNLIFAKAKLHRKLATAAGPSMVKTMGFLRFWF